MVVTSTYVTRNSPISNTPAHEINRNVTATLGGSMECYLAIICGCILDVVRHRMKAYPTSCPAITVRGSSDPEYGRHDLDYCDLHTLRPLYRGFHWKYRGHSHHVDWSRIAKPLHTIRMGRHIESTSNWQAWAKCGTVRSDLQIWTCDVHCIRSSKLY